MAMIKCPECGQEISDKSTSCIKCGCPLNASESLSLAQFAAPRRAPTHIRPSEALGALMLGTPWVAILLIFFWVGNMMLIQGPGNSLDLIVIVTIASTAMLAAVEASSLGMKGDRKAGTYGPAAWFFLVALFWVVGYPAYLFKRRRYGMRNYLFIGILTTAAFIGAAYVMQQSINSQVDQIRQNLTNMQQRITNIQKSFGN